MSNLPGWIDAPPIDPVTAAVACTPAGFRGDAIAIAVAIAWAESGLVPNARHVNSGGSIDRGLWQINDRAHPDTEDQNCDIPVLCAQYAYRISSGGTDWGAWATFNNGAYRKFYNDAVTAAQTAAQQGLIPGTELPTVNPSIVALPENFGTSLDVFPPELPTPGELAYDPGGFSGGLIVNGKLVNDSDGIGSTIVGGDMDLTTNGVSQLTLQIVDPFGENNVWSQFLLNTPVSWFDCDFIVAEHDMAPAGDVPVQLTAICRTKGVQTMRDIDPLGRTRMWEKMSPTEVLEQRALEAGLRFAGKGSARRSTITRHGVADAGSTKAESDWEMGDRLAKELGYWAFEAMGIYFFAPPSWLADKMPRYRALWAPGKVSGDLAKYVTIGHPKLSASMDTEKALGKTWPRTISMELLRSRGEAIRPAMMCDWTSIGGFDTAYITTHVNWKVLDGGVTPVTIDGTEPIDPVPSGDPDNPTSTPAGSTSNAQLDPVTGRPYAAVPSALDFVTLCLKQVGDAYQWGAGHSATDLGNTDPSAFDCSGLIGWACTQLGVDFTGTDATMMQKIVSANLERSVADAANIRGAVLRHPGHIAVSLGDGAHTVEAMGKQYGVLQGNIGNRFSQGGLIPGLAYGTGA